MEPGSVVGSVRLLLLVPVLVVSDEVEDGSTRMEEGIQLLLLVVLGSSVVLVVDVELVSEVEGGALEVSWLAGGVEITVEPGK
jgi:hypothetical protein